MSTRFEKKIVLPAGPTGPATLLGLSREDQQSVARWHRKEWEQFLEEFSANRLKILERIRYQWMKARECPKCRARRQRIYDAMQRFPKPVLMAPLSGMGVRRAAWGGAGADCTYTASTIANLLEFNTEPTNSYTHARLHNDGDWYSNAATTTSWGVSEGTWQGGCAIADYDARWNQNTGDTENSVLTVGTNGTWQAASTTTAVGYQVLTIGVLSGTFDLQLRDGTSLNVLFTDAFTMQCEVDARN